MTENDRKYLQVQVMIFIFSLAFNIKISQMRMDYLRKYCTWETFKMDVPSPMNFT